MGPSIFQKYARFWLLICLLTLSLLSSGCSSTLSTSATTNCSGLPKPVRKAQYKVGFSQSGSEDNNPWRLAESTSMRDEAHKRGVLYIATSANSSEVQQIADVNMLIRQKVDVLFISPLSEKPLAQAVLAAHSACIPVFLLDRDVDHTIAAPGRDYVSFLGSDFLSQGRRAAEWLIAATHGQAKILELEGTAGSSPAILRKQGFEERIKQAPGMHLLDSLDGNFTRIQGAQAFQLLLAAHPDATAVFAHNDEMALGAIDVLSHIKQAGGKKMIIVSIDGEHNGLQAIIAGTLGASIESNPRFGPLAFSTFDRYLNNAQLPPWIKMQDRLFTKENAALYLKEAF
jgi:galactofuranose transport system substrate-binding protein